MVEFSFRQFLEAVVKVPPDKVIKFPYQRPATKVAKRLPPVQLDDEDDEIYNYAMKNHIAGTNALAQRYAMLGNPDDPEWADMKFRGRGRGNNQIILPHVHVWMQHLRDKVAKLGYDDHKAMEFVPNSLERQMRVKGTHKIAAYPKNLYHANPENPNDELFDKYKDDVLANAKKAALTIVKQYSWAKPYIPQMILAAVERIRANAGGTLPDGKGIDSPIFRHVHATNACWKFLRTIKRNFEPPEGEPSHPKDPHGADI